jgi:hypothetical protein
MTVVAALGASLACLHAADRKPNFSGVWMTEGPGRQEVWTIKHDEPKIEIHMKIDDRAGKRQLHWSGATDGKEHAQTVDGTPAVLIAQWKGSRLVVETRRPASFGPVHVRRVFTLSSDGKTIDSDTENLATPAKSKETWRKQ